VSRPLAQAAARQKHAALVEALRGHVMPHSAHAPSGGRRCASKAAHGAVYLLSRADLCPGKRPECREAPLHPRALWRTLAQDDAGQRGLGWRAPDGVRPRAARRRAPPRPRPRALRPSCATAESRLRSRREACRTAAPERLPLAVGTACTIPIFACCVRRGQSPASHTARVITSSHRRARRSVVWIASPLSADACCCRPFIRAPDIRSLTPVRCALNEAAPAAGAARRPAKGRCFQGWRGSKRHPQGRGSYGGGVDHKHDGPAIVDEKNSLTRATTTTLDQQGHSDGARARCRRPAARRRTSGETADLAAVYGTGSVALVKRPAASSSSSSRGPWTRGGERLSYHPFIGYPLATSRGQRGP